jgi:DNA-directed RNA polymerase omega subunit
MEKSNERVDSKFRYVLLASERAEQLMRGAQTKAADAVGKPTRIAMEELNRNLFEWDYGPAPEEEPLSEEGEGEEGDDEAS